MKKNFECNFKTSNNGNAGKNADTEWTGDHVYAMNISMANKRKDGAPITPTKLPVVKKSKAVEPEEVSNTAILNAIRGMEKKFEEQLEQLRTQAKESTSMIASLTKAVQFNAEEVKECRKKINELEKHNEYLNKENKDLKERMREQEQYKMRWCLKLKGLQEKNEENIRADIIQLCTKLVPDKDTKQLEEATDIVHRVGRKEDNCTRQVVILFAKRLVKEEIWRRSKDSQVCRERGVRFAEMLPREDREARRILWPQIEQARKDGKTAYFRGPHGYIEGKQIG